MSGRVSSAVAIRQFQSEAELLRATREPIGISIALWTLSALMFGGVAASFVVPVQRVVKGSNGDIVTADAPSVFQALDPSIIKSIDVKEGQTVEAGQMLATLDPTFATADVLQSRQQIAGLKAQIARDGAESTRTPFDPAVQPGSPDAPYWSMQKTLYDQRKAEFDAQVRSFAAKITQQETTLAKLRSDEGRYEEREKISKQVQDMRDTLYKSGASSLIDLLSATDQHLEIQRTMEFGQNAIIEADHTLASLKADRDAYVQTWLAAVSQDMLTARNTLDQAQATLDKAVRHQDLVRLTSPTRGVVLSVAKRSVGSVLQQGDTLMRVMPVGSQLEAETQVSGRDVGYIRQGDSVTLEIDAYNPAEHGTAQGVVKWISEGAFTTDADNKTVPAFYKVRIAITGYHFTDMPADFRLVPGMTLQAQIHVGKHSLAKYILGGALRGAGENMRDN